ncbi:PREDICTED: alpha-crystallin domain-containing protein 22.3-like [Nicotiana attenuata]|uniref:Alpha-crystallin domain-containing protein 22.3 n=1 Tax=Nicotiana attenuata TaxID=49451 RepID=A0A1J6IGV9_NICAT|nr:PREDICTED: alpha-crystallin domain-containing protein 22.3-like [Nicotiana attenuata]OIT03898.1 alpha-crystallin domain-containing protein 22.3 [Nicotiana attenuata]
MSEYLNMYIEYPFSYQPDDVVQTGAAVEGRPGVPTDPVTVSISEYSYKFNVILPAVTRNVCDVSVDILYNGEVEIEGRVNAGVVTSTWVPISFNRRARRVTPPGHFTINFTLPGPCDTNFAKAKLNSDGVVEGVVLKDGIFKAH